jgi:hypothetical protein
MATTATHAELARHLAEVVGRRLLDPLEILLGEHLPGASDPLTTVRARVRADAEMWAAQLLGEDRALATATAARLVAVLYPGDEPFDPPAEWWRTPFGQVVARRVGHPTAEAVSYPVAGAMLGVTRQGVHDLVTRGRLTRHPAGGVLVRSVQARLAGQDAAR